jgi:hypothetical protein
MQKMGFRQVLHSRFDAKPEQQCPFAENGSLSNGSRGPDSLLSTSAEAGVNFCGKSFPHSPGRLAVAYGRRS